MEYKGHEIFECGQYGIGHCNGRGWHVQTHHKTGIPWAEQECPRYGSLAEAKRAITEQVAYEKDLRAAYS